ncbi:MAG: twin-arginine translocase TatA/TatE family subunit [Novosphingobium sp.]|nr:twin-arginine translocase TatA/TatE family subunit [Novosphingobium sp.]
MMGLSLPHLIVLALVVLVLFGRGRISEMMGDFGKGIKSFKEGMTDETTNRPVTPPPAQIPAQPGQTGIPPQAVQPTLNGDPVADPNRTTP